MRVDAEKDGVARLAADHDDRITPVGRVIRAIRFDDGKWTRLTEGCILRAPVPAAMTPQVGLVTQQYQTTVYDILIYKVSTQRDPLRLRSGPGTDYRILGKYAKETEIIVLDKSNSGWYEVTCPDGKHGYIPFLFRLTHFTPQAQSASAWSRSNSCRSLPRSTPLPACFRNNPPGRPPLRRRRSARRPVSKRGREYWFQP